MAEDSPRVNGLASGLAVLLNSEDGKEHSSNTRLLSYSDDIGNHSVERSLEYIFALPNKSVDPLNVSIDSNLISLIIKNQFSKYHAQSDALAGDRDGIGIIDIGYGPHVIGLDELSICGDIRIIKPPLLVESLAMFSSARANACVWKGKWMYEVILETSGVQQLGWATLSCPFTDRKGVGDADDSYAYDGKRVMKWNKQAEQYGQSWVVGDVIGCCIDLDHDEISFYRNGASLGLAFDGIRKMGPGFGYYPAISISQGERCELNFGARPFRFPIEGYFPLQASPLINTHVTELLQCLSRLLDMQSMERAQYSLVERMRRLKRSVSFEDLFHPVSHGICVEFFSVLEADAGSTEYIVWGPLLSFMMEVFGLQAPHDYSSLDRFLDVFLEFKGSRLIFEHFLNSLSCACKTASMVLTECPYSGSYCYLALACHILRREELMVLWWKSSDFELLFEGFLSQKSPNQHDFQGMMPSVWWPGSCEDVSYESSMILATSALSEAVSKIEEKHRELCLLVIQFIPPMTPSQLPGSVFRTFLQNLLLKNRGADRSISPPGVSSNCVLVSLYTVILHFLSEGFGVGEICGWLKSCETSCPDVGFLHRGGQQSFPLDLFLKDDPHRNDISRLGGLFSHLLKTHPVDQEEEVVRWEEGCMDDEETRATHLTDQKPCCCSSIEVDFARNSKDQIRMTAKGSRVHYSPIAERSAHVAAECSAGSLSDEIADKPSTSDQSESEFGYQPVRHMRTAPRESIISSAILREEELLDTLLLLYHVGLAPNFRQASYYMSHQSHLISLLEETDKQIREQASGEQLRRLKEARIGHREEVIDCVRHCTWNRISLFSRWKQRGMYAVCMWIVQLLLVLSKVDSLFIYVPEYYIEALVDCFHVLRKSDPPFVPPSIFIKQGLTSFVTFIVTHFNDPRIVSADLRDLLLQSISVLVRFKEHLATFEDNEAAVQRMPKALLSAFDNRSWIPVTNILLRLCKGSGFGLSKLGESSSSSSVIFQRLLREACVNDEDMFSAFLNRLFNTLSWTMTEFSVSVREMQEKYQVVDFQQRKCCVIFDLSCNLARILEFCTREIPQTFLSGADTNLRRLTELVVFILNQITSAADAEFFDLSFRRNGQSSEKVNRYMILAPLVGIILNLLDASAKTEYEEQNDIVSVFASLDCPDTVHCGFQYLLEFNWAGSFRGDPHLSQLRQLENFLCLLISRTESLAAERTMNEEISDVNDSMCCICYAREADAQFSPCSHRSCYGCISRHLLNCERCFFCNATVLDVIRSSKKIA
ncbi:E3 ubiquitin-protein ligase RKP [Tripterygium wilfordii]|uniref:RING-type E3 ubiquitin transferase n=1 Tax=Tripterygium wilfordii TaxID=458696 RepID=A0A7J7DU90_TRIWF|nr:E3 ubiquitin-protein ligase RKP [Tripterygium wilfordii]KAF5749930.1 E3 ubiquitin-protein ligase RKP [Tripterygium wilfordii]